MAKNIIVLDVESTGLDKMKDHIIQFSGIEVDPEKYEIIRSLNLYIKPSVPYTMSLGAFFKHHITPSQLQDELTFAEVADTITEFIGDNDVLVYNGLSFDIPMLKNEYARCGKVGPDWAHLNIYDAFLEEKRRNGNTLEETFKRYANGRTMLDEGLQAHDALSDIKATLFVFTRQQLDKEYGPEAIIGDNDLLGYSLFNDKEQPCFKVGKYRGVSLEYVMNRDQNYLNWVISDKSGFGENTKNYLKQFIVK